MAHGAPLSRVPRHCCSHVASAVLSSRHPLCCGHETKKRGGLKWHALGSKCRASHPHPYKQGHGPYAGAIDRSMIRLIGSAELKHTLTAKSRA